MLWQQTGEAKPRDGFSRGRQERQAGQDRQERSAALPKRDHTGEVDNSWGLALCVRLRDCRRREYRCAEVGTPNLLSLGDLGPLAILAALWGAARRVSSAVLWLGR